MNGGVAEAQPAVDAFDVHPNLHPVENGSDNPGHVNPGTLEAAPAPVYGNPGHSMEETSGEWFWLITY